MHEISVEKCTNCLICLKKKRAVSGSDDVIIDNRIISEVNKSPLSTLISKRSICEAERSYRRQEAPEHQQGLTNECIAGLNAWKNALKQKTYSWFFFSCFFDDVCGSRNTYFF